MNRRSILARVGAAAILLAVGNTAVPQTAATRYNIEIVVFRSNGTAGALPAGTPTLASADDGIEMTVAPVRRLGEAARKLRATAGFKVLGHTAWTQTPVGCLNAACRTVVRGVTAEQLGLSRAGVSGKVVLQRGTYLFLGVDLTIDEGGRRYRIQEARQMKPDQPQYFDHPAVGVLAIVTAATP